MADKTQLWTITICRIDSEVSVVYKDVKHFWWEETKRLVVSQLDEPGVSDKHHYFIWPERMISHVKAERQ